MTQPAVSVVIPTCNRPALLAQCLDHLLLSIERSGRADIEVIVADDGAGAQTRVLVGERYPRVKWIAGPRGGPARNRNRGAQVAAGRWIFFTDDDCLPSPDWVAALLRAVDAAGAVKVLEGCTVADRAQRRLDEEAPVNTTGGYLWACNMAVERSLFERLDGFCAAFPYAGMEDADFRLRVRKAGEEIRFVPDAVVCHPLRKNKGHAYQIKVARSFLLLVERHPELMGAAPWRNTALNLLRRLRHVSRQAVRWRFRGFGFALGAIAIQTCSEVVAVSNLRRRAR